MRDNRLRSTGWPLAILLAFIVHVMTLALALFPPAFLANSPMLPDIQTVELINVLDLAIKPAAKPITAGAPPQLEAPAKIAKPPIVAKTPQIPVHPVVTKAEKKMERPPALAVKEPISYNPVKQREEALKKIEARVQERFNNEQLLKSRLEQLKAINNKQVSEEKAREAARSAISKLKDLYRQNSSKIVKQPSVQTAAAVSGSASKKLLDDKQVLYWTSALMHIQKFWTLPDLQGWDKTLEAVYVISVHREGGIKKKYFERKSDNIFFNTFVEKAIKDADPLPAFPADFPDNEMEIGLIFHPAGLL